jgi:hypothetical protein
VFHRLKKKIKVSLRIQQNPANSFLFYFIFLNLFNNKMLTELIESKILLCGFGKNFKNFLLKNSIIYDFGSVFLFELPSTIHFLNQF